MWDAGTGKRLYALSGPVHGDIVYDVEFSPDGKSLISASADKSAKVWTFGAESSKLEKTLSGHSHLSQPVAIDAWRNLGGLDLAATAPENVRVGNGDAGCL